MKTRLLFLLAAVGVAHVTWSEPMFLSKQYARCTTCHYSPTGGGLLTPYGRSLTRELSTTGASHGGEESGAGEQGFLWGLLGNRIAPLDLGVDLRPAHLAVSSAGFTSAQSFFMNADVLAAVRTHGWTLYGEIGREPVPPTPKIASYEYWIAHDSEGGFGFRVGRFLPAYGIRLADHTAFTRLPLGLDVFDQVLALELSHTSSGHLWQVSVGPGPADSAITNDGRRSLTATGRFQFDLSPRTALVVSGLLRDASQLAPRNGAGGVAFGFSPSKHISVWTEADLQLQASIGASAGGSGYAFLNETSIEVYRGLWLKVSPQLRTDIGNSNGGTFRTVIEADLLPRTHWNVDVAVYRDVDRQSSIVTRTILAQLHLYL